MRIAGVTLIVVALLGFAFVADDLDHPNELFGTTVVLVTGLALLGRSIYKGRQTRLAVVRNHIEALPSDELEQLRRWFARLEKQH